MQSAYAYLHGFGSSSSSFKGTRLAGLLAPHGVELDLADINEPSFAELTYSGSLSVLDRMDRRTPRSAPWRFIGSSYGGYVAARWCELHPDRVDRLLLLCPGFDMPNRWPALLGPEAMTRWRAQGALTFPDSDGTPTPVGWGFIEDAMTHPASPEIPPAVPTLIVHGTWDEVVPVETSRDYAASRDHVRLIEVDDDHGLTRSVERIAEEALAFFSG